MSQIGWYRTSGAYPSGASRPLSLYLVALEPLGSEVSAGQLTPEEKKELLLRSAEESYPALPRQAD